VLARILSNGASAVTKIVSLLILLVTVLACSLPATPAQAQRDRVFVASYGSDSNPCTFGSPCKTFQNAVNVVAQGGEVTAIDSAGFGTIAIAHAVTITSPNGVEAGIAAPASGSAAITISAGPSDTIDLNGLTLDGDGIANTIGVQFNSGGSLEIRNSMIRNFGSYGLLFEPSASSQLFVSNTRVSDNVASGIHISPAGPATINGVLDHVEIANNNGHGLIATVAASLQTVNLTLSDSVVANSATDGIVAKSTGGTAVNILVRNSTIANQPSAFGLVSNGTGAIIWVTRSTITGNNSPWEAPAGGILSTYGDNSVAGNANPGTGSTSITYQ
jgi:hypothetical protein